MSRNYSDSAFFNWLRIKVFKIQRPNSFTWGSYKKWNKDLEECQPFAYFLVETLPDLLEWIPEHTIDYVNSVRYYVTNRINNSHRLNSTLEKGKYHEFSERLLYSAFDSFVTFIEAEEAAMHIAWREEKDIKKYNVPFWSRYWIFRWGKAWRCEEAAIDHLKWEMTLDQPDPSDPHHTMNEYQAVTAREKMSLYTWWKHIRPQRGESWDVTGFRKFWDEMDAKYGSNWIGLSGTSKMTPTELRKYNKLQKESDELEERWEDEDEAMLIRLVKIRKALWT